MQSRVTDLANRPLTEGESELASLAYCMGVNRMADYITPMHAKIQMELADMKEIISASRREREGKQKREVKNALLYPYAFAFIQDMAIEIPGGKGFDLETQSGPDSEMDEIVIELSEKLEWKDVRRFEDTGSLEILDGLAYDHQQS